MNIRITINVIIGIILLLTFNIVPARASYQCILDGLGPGYCLNLDDNNGSWNDWNGVKTSDPTWAGHTSTVYTGYRNNSFSGYIDLRVNDSNGDVSNILRFYNPTNPAYSNYTFMMLYGNDSGLPDKNTWNVFDTVKADSSGIFYYKAPGTNNRYIGYGDGKASVQITDVTKDTISYNLNKDWKVSYDLSFTNSKLNVDVKIYIDPSGHIPSASLKNYWEESIENIWSNRYEIADGQYKYPLLVNVDFVDNKNDANETIKVHWGLGRWDTANWYAEFDPFYTDNLQAKYPAHEFGHMLGLYDEYSDAGATYDPDNPIKDNGAIMGRGFEVRDRYFEKILDWLEGKSNRVLAFAPTDILPYPLEPNIDFADGPPTGTAVPEPATMLLLGIGLMGLAGIKARMQ